MPPSVPAWTSAPSPGSTAETARQLEVQGLNLCARPRRLPQELQAGRDARIAGETADRDPFTHPRPAVVVDERVQHALERDAVKRVRGGLRGCGHRRRPRRYTGQGLVP